MNNDKLIHFLENANIETIEKYINYVINKFTTSLYKVNNNKEYEYIYFEAKEYYDKFIDILLNIRINTISRLNDDIILKIKSTIEDCKTLYPIVNKGILDAFINHMIK